MSAQKRWKDRNRERVREYGRAYYAKNKDQIREKWRKFADQNPEKIKAYRLKSESNSESSAKRRETLRLDRMANPGKYRDKAFRSRYGITEADYTRLLSAQNRTCAICGTSDPKGKGRRFHVDHDHASGIVRGLLCSKCNLALGFYEGWFRENESSVMAYMLGAQRKVG